MRQGTQKTVSNIKTRLLNFGGLTYGELGYGFTQSFQQLCSPLAAEAVLQVQPGLLDLPAVPLPVNILGSIITKELLFDQEITIFQDPLGED